MSQSTAISKMIAQNYELILRAWVKAQSETRTVRLMSENELETQCRSVLDNLRSLDSYALDSPSAQKTLALLVDINKKRGLQGFSPTEVATFIFSLKSALLPFLKDSVSDDPARLAEETASMNALIDQFGLATFAAYAESRDQYIKDQQKAILELSTPVVEVWDSILALPIVGAVDTARTQQMMESLLNKIVETGSSVIIIDITGVPVVDTAVARHLLQTVAAARLLGADCILVGISARIAQTLVHIGVDLSSMRTGTTLARGLAMALSMTERKIVKVE